jgi:hypothetical protein
VQRSAGPKWPKACVRSRALHGGCRGRRTGVISLPRHGYNQEQRARSSADRRTPCAADAARPRLVERRRPRRHRARHRDRQRGIPARTGGVRQARPDSVVGHRRGDLLPDCLQHRGDALRRCDRRACRRRLHAHAAFFDPVGVGLRPVLFPASRLAGVGCHCRQRCLLPVRWTLAGARRCRDGVLHWRRHVPALHCLVAHRPTHRAHIGNGFWSQSCSDRF